KSQLAGRGVARPLVEFNPASSGKRLRADPEFVIRYRRSFRDAQTARNLSLTRRFCEHWRNPSVRAGLALSARLRMTGACEIFNRITNRRCFFAMLPESAGHEILPDRAHIPT